jgi:hypothetical protein
MLRKTPVSETNNKSLTIFHSNIRSLRNKINYISDIIEDFDIVFFTETHLDYNIIQTHRHFGSFPKTTSTGFMVEKPNYNSM